MAAGMPERIVAVDWSGDKGPGQKKKIWACVWTAARGRRRAQFTLESGRTREQLAAYLLDLARETPAMVVGVDCCFSYPAWFLRECGAVTVFDFWAHVAGGAGERWLTGPPEAHDGRFWGRPHPRPAQFSGEHLPRMMRRTDMENKIEQALAGGDPVRAALMAGVQPKSPFQIGGAGSVGTGSLRAMGWLAQLREGGFRVWPFEDAALGAHAAFSDSQAAPAKPMLVEIYTRLLTGPVKKANPGARRAYLADRRELPRYARLPAAALADAEGSEDAFDALVCGVEMVRFRGEFAGLRATDDPELRLEGVTWRPGLV